jgi:hypothetical protein
VYRGEQLPGLQGAYVFGDWGRGNGRLFAAFPPRFGIGAWEVAELEVEIPGQTGGLGQLLAVEQNGEGELYLLVKDPGVGPIGMQEGVQARTGGGNAKARKGQIRGGVRARKHEGVSVPCPPAIARRARIPRRSARVPDQVRQFARCNGGRNQGLLRVYLNRFPVNRLY